mmetsp:Transcript_17131/g.26739  ORF Transcript_17131/g.26739 Transcript_17131/m.26739 type:complete len:95 (+) Transcript_17131:248-532(+)
MNQFHAYSQTACGKEAQKITTTMYKTVSIVLSSAHKGPASGEEKQESLKTTKIFIVLIGWRRVLYVIGKGSRVRHWSMQKHVKVELHLALNARG